MSARVADQTADDRSRSWDYQARDREVTLTSEAEPRLGPYEIRYLVQMGYTTPERTTG